MPKTTNDVASAGGGSGVDKPIVEKLQAMKVSDGFSNTSTSPVYLLSICANCGKEGSDLKSCAACKLVKYCNRECQSVHRSKHKKQCKKRVAELHDEKLFTVPPQKEDCPICFLRMPSLASSQIFMACCGKTICSGCFFASAKIRGDKEKCPFCRTPAPELDRVSHERNKKRIERNKNDANAIFSLACDYDEGLFIPQNQAKALELWHRAGELGSSNSYYNIGYAYQNADGVGRDQKKARYYWELAAMLGHAEARYNLGALEYNKGNYDKAVKHYMISAGLGCNESLKQIQILFKSGIITKDDYTTALRLYQAYLDEVRSNQRNEAAAYSEIYKYY